MYNIFFVKWNSVWFKNPIHVHPIVVGCIDLGRDVTKNERLAVDVNCLSTTSRVNPT